MSSPERDGDESVDPDGDERPLTAPDPGAPADPAAGGDVVAELMRRNLTKEDVGRILKNLAGGDHDEFTSKLVDLLRKTSAMLLVSKRLADSLSLQVLLPRMVELISDFLDAERCTIFLHDFQTEELYTKAAVGLEEEIRIPADKGIAGAVFKTGEPVNIEDAYADSRFNPEVDRQTGFRTRNLIAVPIRHLSEKDSAVVGVVQVLNKRNGSFTDDDVALLGSLNSQAVAAFINAVLHEEVKKATTEQRRLLDVTTALSRELQLHPLLVKIMSTVAEILEADRATLFVFDRGSDELWALAGEGTDKHEIRFPTETGIAGHVFRTGETVNLGDAYADSRFNPAVDQKTGYKTQSILCMPVIGRNGHTIAVTQVLNKQGGLFTPMDERRLAIFSAQAAVAMENAQLFEEVTRVKNYNESVLEGMNAGVLTLDSGCVVVKVNRAALRLLGATEEREAVLGCHVRSLFNGPNSWVATAVEKVQQTHQPVVTMDSELSPLRGNDSSSVNLTALPLSTEGSDAPGCILMLDDITSEKRLKSTMARYVTPQVADRIADEGASALGGKMTDATVLFSDIRDFTALSEELGPRETVRLLNDYFGVMVDVVLDHDGMLDKFIGDSIMAVFGVPYANLDDADRSVQTAIAMFRALHSLNAKRHAEGHEPIRMGVGINTDTVLSGNVGSEKRMDYTVIGDGVNLASRLESANKIYGTEILVSESTYRRLRQGYVTREIDKIRVKGKTRPAGVFEVLDHHGNGDSRPTQEFLDTYTAALDLYRSRKWSKAIEAFARSLALRPGDKVCALYVERCTHLCQAPPKASWDGVWQFDRK